MGIVPIKQKSVNAKPKQVSQKNEHITNSTKNLVNSIFLFCGSRLDRYKGIYWDGDGFYLLYKRIENGKLQWPRDSTEARKLSKQEIRWLLEGFSLNQKKAVDCIINQYYKLKGGWIFTSPPNNQIFIF